MLENARNSREPPVFLACDEQTLSYFGHKSGAKKRLPKKTMEGLEYYALATSNKGYEGWKHEVRAPPEEGKGEGRLIRPADPVCGGLKLNYAMLGGPKYDFGSTDHSKTFGLMSELIFSLGDYLRFKDVFLVPDSAYGFLTGMLFLAMWGIK